MTAAVVLRGDARHLPLPDASVDLIVTSPPYFGLRSYTDGGEHYGGQIGSEATPQEWLAALVECTTEWVRVLKPSGSIFVNLGDKYAVTPQRWLTKADSRSWEHANATRRHVTSESQGNVRPKSLMGLPWRYAIACTGGGPALWDSGVIKLLLRDVALGVIPLWAAEEIVDDLAAMPDPGLGLILRRDIIWSKPNGLPESVTDRCRSSHEYVFHLVKQPRYYAAVDEIRTPQTGSMTARSLPAFTTRDSNDGSSHRAMRRDPETFNPLGKLPGSVWNIPSQPLTVPDWLGIDHFAAFPMELPRRIILGWSPPGVCTACGEGRRPVTCSQRTSNDALRPPVDLDRRKGGHHGMGSSTLGPRGVVATITGYACACPQPTAPTRPALVVDPFGGTGTTALVAAMHGRLGVTVDMSADYSRLAAWRTQDPAQRAAAMQVPKPPPIPAGQQTLDDLFMSP